MLDPEPYYRYKLGVFIKKEKAENFSEQCASLRALRIAHGISEPTIAAKVGCSQAAISQLLNLGQGTQTKLEKVQAAIAELAAAKLATAVETLLHAESTCSGFRPSFENAVQQIKAQREAAVEAHHEEVKQ